MQLDSSFGLFAQIFMLQNLSFNMQLRYDEVNTTVKSQHNCETAKTTVKQSTLL